MSRCPPSPSHFLLLHTALVGFSTLSGCASNQPVTGGGGVRVITETEIQASDADDVLELIQQLRPAWLVRSVLGDPSDPAQTEGPSVLINDIPPKPLFSLQFLPLENIKEIRFLTRTAAETRFRVGARDGLILILTHSGAPPEDTIPPDTGAVIARPPKPEPPRPRRPHATWTVLFPFGSFVMTDRGIPPIGGWRPPAPRRPLALMPDPSPSPPVSGFGTGRDRGGRREQLYQALKRRGIDTRLVVYPGQPHGLRIPSYNVHRYKEYLAWYDKYVKGEEASDAR